jgi:hypothetical protein
MADHPHNQGAGGGGAGRWIFWGFVLVAAYFLLTEHRAHTIQYLPFLLLLACPLMHLFHGHGGHGSGKADDGADDRKPSRPDADRGEDTRSTQRSHH